MQYTNEQVMLTLAFISYLGFYEISDNERASHRISRSINEALKRLRPVAGEWQVVWGPAHFRFPLTVFDDNLMYVVQSTRDPAKYAIVIRGTNPLSVTNWLLEDFSVMFKTPWPYKAHPPGLSPMLSKGSAIGLQALQRMIPDPGLPGAGLNLYKFLASETARNPSPRLSVSVTGHSLGGALAPTTALWLADTQTTSDDAASPPWDPGMKATIDVYPIAGPSPGDKDFARYYDQRLGPNTRRMWNQYDMIPHGWSESLLSKLPKLYDPHVIADPVARVILWGTTVISNGGNYLQIVSDTPALEGGQVVPPVKNYLLQAMFQHTVAYPLIMGLHADIDTLQHFDFAEDIRHAIHEAIQHVVKDHVVPDLTPQRLAADLEAERRRLEMSLTEKVTELSKAVVNGVPDLKNLLVRQAKRAFQVPATIVLAVMHDAVSLPALRRRQGLFDDRFKGLIPNPEMLIGHHVRPAAWGN